MRIKFFVFLYQTSVFLLFKLLDYLKYSSDNKNLFILNDIINKIKERYRRDENQIRYKGREFANPESQTRLFTALAFINSILINNKGIFAIFVPDIVIKKLFYNHKYPNFFNRFFISISDSPERICLNINAT